MKAGIGICNIPKSAVYPKSSGDKKTLKDLVWKATRWIDGEQVHEEKGFRDKQAYVPSNETEFLLFVFELTKQSVFCLSVVSMSAMRTPKMS